MPEAATEVAFLQETTNAAIQRAEASEQSQYAKTDGARVMVTMAAHGAQEAAATIGAAQASYDRAHPDGVRYAVLLKHDAVTPQQYDLAQAADQSTRSQLDAARDQAAQAQVEVQEAGVQQPEGQ